jgi:cytochrome bd ubiquinol oxidase subunit I
MNPIILSRWQFATTTIYHFFFVPLTLGLSWFVAIMETAYVRTGNETYKRMAKFWGKLFLINFSMGVVTGIVQEFQFGMNWSAYSRYVGDIFGVPLAMEGLMAFFLESTFLGIWTFGWDRLPKGLHAATIWLVVLGSNLSALFILLANGFMQDPVGYTLNEAAGRLELVDFGALFTNARGWWLFVHAITAGLTTAALFVLGISAYHLARKEHTEVFEKSFRIAAIISIIAGVTVGLAGHFQGTYVLEVQPMAALASEANWETAESPPFKVAAIFDSSLKHEIWSLEIPIPLNWFYLPRVVREIPGINQLQAEYSALYGPGDYVPLVGLDFWMFRIMVGVGLLIIALAAYALYLPWKKWPQSWTRWLKWMPLAIALPYIANTSGWILTETSRQPWIVSELLKTENAISPNLGSGIVLFSLLGFVLIYAVLMIVDAYLLVKYAKAGPDAAMQEAVDLAPSAGGAQY